MKGKQAHQSLSLYRIPPGRWAGIVLAGMGIGLFAVWLCYHSVKALPVAFPLAALYCLDRYGECVEENRLRMREHFRDFLTSVHTAVRSGYSLENAVRSGYRDLTALYGSGDLLVMELEKLVRQLDYRVPIEKLLRDLAVRTEIEEMQSFGELVMITKRTGGNMGRVLQDTWRLLNRRMDTESEIATLIAAKKYEQSLMSLMPAGMILYLRFTFPGFVETLYGNLTGVCLMTVVLLLYLAAVALGRRMVRIEV